MKTQPIYLLLFAILITSIAVGQPASRPFIERNYRTTAPSQVFRAEEAPRCTLA
jgi:hypothetical protein